MLKVTSVHNKNLHGSKDSGDKSFVDHRLPDEVTQFIFLFLLTPDLLSVANTCKHWHKIVKQWTDKIIKIKDPESDWWFYVNKENENPEHSCMANPRVNGTKQICYGENNSLSELNSNWIGPGIYRKKYPQARH